LNADVVSLGVFLVAAGLMTWFLRRRVEQRAVNAARGHVIKVPCALRHPSVEGRWLRGRLLIGPSAPVWEPRTRAGAGLTLPEGLREVGMRSPTWREGMMINRRSTIVEYSSPEGVLLVVVMPNELHHVLGALERGN
jgi:hypothetical protein